MATYPTATVEIPVAKGTRYLWIPGASEVSMRNVDETYTVRAEFIALGGNIIVTVTTAGALVTGQLRPLLAWANSATGLNVVDWLKHTYNGVRRLFFVSGDGFINLYEEGYEDELADEQDQIVFADIEDELLTRGYTAANLDPKRFKQANLQLLTWNPRFSIDALFDGVNEQQQLKEAVTKSRTRYYRPFDAAPYNVTNLNDDHATPFREDYTVVLADSTTLVWPGTGRIKPDEQQETTERMALGQTAKFAQLRIRNTRGRMSIQSALVDASAGPRRHGTHA